MGTMSDLHKRKRFFVRNEIVLCFRGGNSIDATSVEQWIATVCDDLQPPVRLKSRAGDADRSDLATFVSEQSDDPFPTTHIHLFVLEFQWQLGMTLEDDEKHDESIRQYVTRLNTNPNEMVGNGAFVSASPNWLFVGSQVQLVGGGPGGIPVLPDQANSKDPVKPTSDDYTLVFPKLRDLPKPIAALQGDKMKANEPVVVIFDTVPPKDTWDRVLDTHSDHALLPSLHSKLQIFYADNTFKQQIPSDDVFVGYAHEPDYEVTDHGLFSAGLIHSAASCARIYLVEVLNKYGAGSFLGLLQALEVLANGSVLNEDDQQRPLIVNLSLTISFKGFLENGSTYDDLARLFPELAEAAEAFTDYVREFFVEPLRRALASVKLRHKDVVIYAAAGNDSDPGVGRYEARFPAAFDGVVGVGAVTDTGADVFYSNLADKPPADGVRTLGGEATRSTTRRTPLGNGVNVSDSMKGLLGVYLGPIPVRDFTVRDAADQAAWKTVQSNGWARWCGTSFATAVMSAMTAKGLCAGMPMRDMPDGSKKGVLDVLEVERTDPQADKDIIATQGKN